MDFFNSVWSALHSNISFSYSIKYFTPSLPPEKCEKQYYYEEPNKVEKTVEIECCTSSSIKNQIEM